jgi:hypothetical protein
LTGSHLILQPGELEAWDRLTTALLSQLQPMTELERQAVAKIIDTHFRLNRLACVENNVFNFGLLDNTSDAPNEDRLEVLIAQTRSWIERAGSFDTLGRYEARLTKQVLQFTRELEHLQQERKHQESIDDWRQRREKKADSINVTSFARNATELITSHEMEA